MSKLPVIFLAFANDKQTAQGFLRNLTEERNTIRDALQKASASQNPVCEVLIEPDISIDKIFSTFQDERYRDRISVFHYGGHAADYLLLLENSKGAKTPVHAQGLIPFLAQQDALQLIFLNGCSTQQQAVDLVKAGVPAVIGTSSVIPDKMAQIIAEWFYRGLGAGLSIDRSWREADQRVRTEHDEEIHRAILEEPGLHTALPWDIRYYKSSNLVKEWNLPDAAQNPVFGLPEIDTTYYLNLPPSPFLGLRRFENNHAGIFFGRNSEIRKLIDKINGIYPVILYYGLSGVGKSSLLEAGLIPRIEKSYTVKVMRRIRDVGLLGTLKTGIKEIISSANASTSESELKGSILSDWQLLEKINGKPLLFILDQAEESYTKPFPGDQDEWETFCTEIKPLINHLGQSASGKIVLSFRSEYLPQIQNTLYNNTIPKTDLLLLPLNKYGIKEAILGVTKNEQTKDQYKLTRDSIEEELAEEIAYDLSSDKNSPVAPTLQIVLSKLWERSAVAQNGQRDLNKDLYHQIRDEGIALSDFVNERFTELQNLNSDSTSIFFNKEIEKSGLVLDILMQFVTPRSTADAFEKERVIALYPHHKDILQPLLDHLIDARLLTSFSGDHTSMIGLSHDTLAPVIREFYENSDRPGQRARRILEGKIISGQEESILDEVDLAQVERGIEGMRIWTTAEQQLVASSRVTRQKRIEQRKRRKILMIASVITIFLFGITGLFLWQVANKKTFEAQTSRLTSRAQLVFSNDQTLGVNLALEAVKRQINQETGLALSTVTGDARAFYQVTFVGHEGYVWSATISPDGKYLLTGSEDKTAKLWTLEGTEVQSFVGHKATIYSVAFSPDGKYVLTGSDDMTAKLWTLDGIEVQSFVGHKELIFSVAFSPRGQYVLTGSDDMTAKLWTLDGTEVQSFVGHDNFINTVAFSPDGKYVLTGSGDKTAKLWTLDGTEVQSFVGHQGAVQSVAFSPDGKYVLTGSDDRTAKLWTLDGTEVKIFLGHHGGVMSVAFSPDGKYVLTGSDDNTVKLWTLDGIQVNTFLGHQDPVMSSAFSPDGKNVITGSADGTAKLWNLQGAEVKPFFGQNDFAVSAVAFSPDGKYVLTGSDLTIRDNTAKLWTLDGTEVQSFVRHLGLVRSVAFSPDGNYVLTGSDDMTAKLWTLDGTEVQSFVGHLGVVRSATISSDGKYVLTGSEDNTAKLWTLDGTEVQSFVGHQGQINPAAFSPDGKNVITGSADGTAKLWNLDGAEVQSFVGHLGLIRSVAFSPDGNYVLTGSQDQTVKLWMLDGTEVQSFVGRSGQVLSVAFSQDGNYVLTTGFSDQMAKLWTINGIEMQSFRVPGGIYSATISPDGKYILASGQRGTKLWLRWDYFQKEGILAPLTMEQRREYGID